MSAEVLTEERSDIFKLFEASLSEDQRRLLLRHPDILNPELIGQLYQASLERLPAEITDPTIPLHDNANEDFERLTTKKPRKMVNSWMTFRCKI